MKLITNTLIIALLVFTGCDKKEEQSLESVLATNNVEQITSKRQELVNKQLEIEATLKKIDNKLSDINPDKNIPLITTLTTKTEEFNHYIELQGNVATKQNLELSPEMGGILRQVYVKEGQKVSKGQLLATIDDGGLTEQRAQLKVQTDLAKTTYVRQKRLWEQKIGSEIQFLQTESNYKTQQESLNRIEKQLAKTRITAPFSGVIDDVIIEPGNVVSPGMSKIIRIVNLKNMYIETDVPERFINSVKKNAIAEVYFPVLGETINAKIQQIGSYINPSNRTFKAEIAIPNNKQSIKPNLTAKLKINDYSNKEAVLIPQNIISENAKNEQYIYVVTNKNEDKATAKQVIIETGETQGNVIEVLKGLSKNDEIIIEGARSVKNGQIVKIIKY